MSRPLLPIARCLRCGSYPLRPLAEIAYVPTSWAGRAWIAIARRLQIAVVAYSIRCADCGEVIADVRIDGSMAAR